LWLAGGELWRWEDMKKNGVSRKLQWRQNKEEKGKKTRDAIFGCCNEGIWRFL